MDLDHHDAREIEIDDLESEFLAGFAAAQPARSYLMGDVNVLWTVASCPRHVGAEMPA
jgi:hypothetical protein